MLERESSSSEIDYNEMFLINDISDRSIRNIVILLNRKTVLQGKEYLRIVGIDVFTGKIVTIVDTNGASKGLHYFNEKMSKVFKYAVIQASFKIYEPDKFINMFRITSDFKILGKTNIGLLSEKYKDIIYKDFISDFKSVFAFSKSNENKTFYTFTKFSNSEVKKERKSGDFKYQIKMDKVFVDICDNRINIAEKEGLHYCGWTIISVMENFSGKPFIKAHCLFGKFYTKQEMERIVKDRKAYNVIYDEEDSLKLYDDFIPKDDFLQYLDNDEFDEEYDEYEEILKMQDQTLDGCDDSYFK